jgi:hypothetical protein
LRGRLLGNLHGHRGRRLLGYVDNVLDVQGCRAVIVLVLLLSPQIVTLPMIKTPPTYWELLMSPTAGGGRLGFWP